MQKKKGEAIKSDGNKYLCMVKGMAIAYGVTCIFFITYGMLITYTNISEDSLPLVALICTALSSAVVGYDWAKCAKQKGLIMGVSAGIVYTILLFAITFLASNEFVMGLSKIMTLVVAMIGGGIGGILGVNRKG